MSDTITQRRLSLRLDTHMSNYKRKNVRENNLLRKEWDTVWKTADAARTQNKLTPELVDDVRLVLNKL